ncbi:hypothetical protein [Vibrio cincinnatiensis]|uniref:hypothetical protein n=1 Tax=Vibrio cincinnatiensis TaxID=675 RepID=UPI001EDE4483|nr:hypothetical protein [Vibrio cincinnatiensis]MCG3728986.1 hypothetical protein [Vibrio cincinnatiensis]
MMNGLGTGSTENKLARLAERGSKIDVEIKAIINFKSGITLPFYLHESEVTAGYRKALLCVPVIILEGYDLKYLSPTPETIYTIAGVECLAISLHRMSPTLWELLNNPTESKEPLVNVNTVFEVNMTTMFIPHLGEGYPTAADFSGPVLWMDRTTLPYTTLKSLKKNLYGVDGAFVLTSNFYTGSQSVDANHWNKPTEFGYNVGVVGGPLRMNGGSGYIRCSGSAAGKFSTFPMAAF